MAKCTRCGQKAGFLKSLCDECFKAPFPEQEQKNEHLPLEGKEAIGSSPPPVSQQPVSDGSPLNTNLQPRSYLATASILFGVTALPAAFGFAFLLSRRAGGHFLTECISTGLIFGLLFGLFFGLKMATFFKGTTITVNVRDRDEFVSRFNVAMSQIGFNPATASGNFLTFKPSFLADLMVGRFSVVIQGSKATIIGPVMHFKELQKRLG